MGKRVIVVGAGLAGLTAGIYAKRSGFDVTIIERHAIPGGMSTSWKRKGYLFEGGIHWMTGSSPKTEAYRIWKETGALDENVKILLRDPFHSLEWEGRGLCIYRDVDKTVEHLSAVSPEDAPMLRRMAKDVKAAAHMEMPVFDEKGVKTRTPSRPSFGILFKMLPAFPVMIRLGKSSCGDWAMRFRHPGLRRLFNFMPEKSPASGLIFTLATLHTGDGGYPEGGSLPMARRMADTFTGLGGEIIYNATVQKIDVRDGRAAGVILESGRAGAGTPESVKMEADAVIVTQETVAALDRLFEEPPRDAWLKDVYELKSKSSVCTFIGIGVRAELPELMMREWAPAEPIKYAGRTEKYISLNSYPQYAPAGGTALTVFFGGDTYDYWKRAKDEGRYETEKQDLADQIARAICEKYPQCAGNIDAIDVATPLTYERYTGAYHGAWMSEMGVGDKMKTYPGECEGVKGLFFAGHRLSPPGGMPVAAVIGRRTAQLVCRMFDAEFV